MTLSPLASERSLFARHTLPLLARSYCSIKHSLLFHVLLLISFTTDEGHGPIRLVSLFYGVKVYLDKYYRSFCC